MGNTGLKLSILDQSPAGESETGLEALQHTIDLAQKAEEWGYHRFWVAEHHDSPRYSGSSPEVLVAHLLARTSRIRVGPLMVVLQVDLPVHGFASLTIENGKGRYNAVCFKYRRIDHWTTNLR